MTVQTSLKKQVDLPVFEWCRFAPVASSAISYFATTDESGGRYIYYLVGAALYRYDTITDSWAQLASAPVTALTICAMRYSAFGGYRGNVISATNNTLTIAGLRASVLVGYTVRIYSGTGAGQTRTITSMTEPTVMDHGVVTTATANVLTDTTKKWQINQWAGYQVSVIYGTGATQRRKVLYNDATNLYFYDVNWQQLDPHNNTGFSAVAPYAAPVATAGVQTMYTIESSDITVDSNWTVNPDYTSKFVVASGALWLLSSAASAPFYTLQYYDIASDTWYTKTAIQGILPAALGTDCTFERITNSGGIYISSTATAGAARTLTDSTLTMTVDRYTNYQIRIIGGTGMGQRRRIVANSATVFYVNRKWDTNPDATSTYEIWDDVHVSYIGGNAASAIYQHHLEADMLTQGSVYDYGIVATMSVQLNGWDNIAVTTAVRNTGGITGINSVPTAGGTGYVVGDVLTISTGGTVGKVLVTGTSPGGIVTSLSLYGAGLTYTTGTGKATTGGTGTGCTVEITTIGTVGRITTAINHNFKIGNSVIFKGAVEAAWNTTYTIIGVDALTTFDVVITATANAAASVALSTSVVVDSSQNWDVNEHTGKLICVAVAGQAPTTQIRRIVSNTATSVTLQSVITAAVNGTSRYVIYDVNGFGRDRQYLVENKCNCGYATGGSTTTLVDSTKNWNTNQWAAYKFRVIAGTGLGYEVTITSNTATTLTYTAPGFTADTTTKYLIMDTFGLATAGSTTTLTDSTKNWTVNQWAGKRFRITSGTGVGQEITINSNTATVLTFTAVTTGPSTDSTYTILGIAPRSTGVEFIHAWGLSDTNERGKYIMLARGGATNTIDKYDIPRELWYYNQFYSPQSETFTTGTMYTYDGHDRMYIQKDSTGRIYEYNVLTNVLSNCCTIPYGMSTAIIGNRMEVVETEDGLRYLYIMRHTATEMWRVLLWWDSVPYSNELVFDGGSP